jgi:hypothetical protein
MQSVGRVGFLWQLIFDECSNQTVHNSVDGVVLISVTVKFIALDNSPVLFESVRLSLEVALAFVESSVSLLVVCGEVVHERKHHCQSFLTLFLLIYRLLAES